jgi:hypothetical protein
MTAKLRAPESQAVYKLVTSSNPERYMDVIAFGWSFEDRSLTVPGLVHIARTHARTHTHTFVDLKERDQSVNRPY